MNMHFQLNLTSSDHVIAAKLRIFKLPQENVTFSSESTFDDEEEDEKKIRISVYYYTKTLKRHRCKSLIDLITFSQLFIRNKLWNKFFINSEETFDGFGSDTPHV